MERIYTDVHKEGHNLIEFRGEKLSGALDFIQKIIQFDKVIEINDAVKRIEECNSLVAPMLLKEIKLIEQELVNLNKESNVLKIKFEKLEEKNVKYEIQKDHLRERVFATIEHEGFNYYEELERQFKELNPKYEEFLSKYKETEGNYKSLTEKINSLEATKTNIDRYNQAINTYFTAKLNQTLE